MLTPAGSNSAAACAAEPCHTTIMRVGEPPTVAASGTVVSITTVPGFHTPFSCFSNGAWPEKGSVSTATSHCAAAAALSAPSIWAAPPIWLRSCCAVSCARPASREPITMCSPARASRFASPDPSGPVPPKIAIFRAIVTPLLGHRLRLYGTQDATLRCVCAIFKNFHHGADHSIHIRVPLGARPICHRGHRGHRRARPRPRPWDDGQLVHFGFARSVADPDLRQRKCAVAAAGPAAWALRREHSQRQSASHFGILRAHRRRSADRKPPSHSIPLDGRQNSAARGRFGAPDMQGSLLARRRRPYCLYRKGGAR